MIQLRMLLSKHIYGHYTIQSVVQKIPRINAPRNSSAYTSARSIVQGNSSTRGIYCVLFKTSAIAGRIREEASKTRVDLLSMTNEVKNDRVMSFL